MRFEGDITSFVGCMTILKNLPAPPNPLSRRRFGARGRHSDRPGLWPLWPLPWICACVSTSVEGKLSILSNGGSANVVPPTSSKKCRWKVRGGMFFWDTLYYAGQKAHEHI